MTKGVVGIAALWVSAIACLRSTEYRCETNAQCSSAGACEAVGYCSVSDVGCGGGRRFDSSAGPYAGQCVGGGGGVDAAIDTPNPACPASYVTLPGAPAHRYRAVDMDEEWPTHQAACAADGPNTYLAIPDDMTELTALAAAVQGSEFWVGISDRMTEGVYASVKGQPQTFLPWDPNEPDNSGNRDCVYVKKSSATLFISNCDDKRATVCECDP